MASSLGNFLQGSMPEEELDASIACKWKYLMVCKKIPSWKSAHKETIEYKCSYRNTIQGLDKLWRTPNFGSAATFLVKVGKVLENEDPIIEGKLVCDCV